MSAFVPYDEELRHRYAREGLGVAIVGCLGIVILNMMPLLIGEAIYAELDLMLDISRLPCAFFILWGGALYVSDGSPIVRSIGMYVVMTVFAAMFVAILLLPFLLWEAGI